MQKASRSKLTPFKSQAHGGTEDSETVPFEELESIRSVATHSCERFVKAEEETPLLDGDGQAVQEASVGSRDPHPSYTRDNAAVLVRRDTELGPRSSALFCRTRKEENTALMPPPTNSEWILHETRQEFGRSGSMMHPCVAATVLDLEEQCVTASRRLELAGRLNRDLTERNEQLEDEVRHLRTQLKKIRSSAIFSVQSELLHTRSDFAELKHNVQLLLHGFQQHFYVVYGAMLDAISRFEDTQSSTVLKQCPLWDWTPPSQDHAANLETMAEEEAAANALLATSDAPEPDGEAERATQQQRYYASLLFQNFGGALGEGSPTENGGGTASFEAWATSVTHPTRPSAGMAFPRSHSPTPKRATNLTPPPLTVLKMEPLSAPTSIAAAAAGTSEGVRERAQHQGPVREWSPSTSSCSTASNSSSSGAGSVEQRRRPQAAESVTGSTYTAPEITSAIGSARMRHSSQECCSYFDSMTNTAEVLDNSSVEGGLFSRRPQSLSASNVCLPPRPATPAEESRSKPLLVASPPRVTGDTTREKKETSGAAPFTFRSSSVALAPGSTYRLPPPSPRASPGRRREEGQVSCSWTSEAIPLSVVPPGPQHQTTANSAVVDAASYRALQCELADVRRQLVETSRQYELDKQRWRRRVEQVEQVHRMREDTLTEELFLLRRLHRKRNDRPVPDFNPPAVPERQNVPEAQVTPELQWYATGGVPSLTFPSALGLPASWPTPRNDELDAGSPQNGRYSRSWNSSGEAAEQSVEERISAAAALRAGEQRRSGRSSFYSPTDTRWAEAVSQMAAAGRCLSLQHDVEASEGRLHRTGHDSAKRTESVHHSLHHPDVFTPRCEAFFNAAAEALAPSSGRRARTPQSAPRRRSGPATSRPARAPVRHRGKAPQKGRSSNRTALPVEPRRRSETTLMRNPDVRRAVAQGLWAQQLLYERGQRQ